MSFSVAAACIRSQSSIHLAHRLDMRALIQSIVLPARSSSSSRHPSSISAKSEKRRAKAVSGTGVSDVVLVVTNVYESAEVTPWKGGTYLAGEEKTIGEFEVVGAATTKKEDQLSPGKK